jgi:ADP-heptose:LPS heptosyltransferase
VTTTHDSRRTVLVLRALGLGDLLTAVPSLRALAQAFPDHRRLLAAPIALRPLVELIGAIDDVVDAAPLETLRGVERPDVAVNLHGRGPQSHEVLLQTRPRRLVAFRRPDIARTDGSPTWRPDEHEVARWCRLLTGSGIPADPSRLDVTAPPPPPDLTGATVLHPGAASAARRWPAERWAAVARAEAEAGRRVVVTGSAGERALVNAVVGGAGLAWSANLAGVTGLREVAALIAGAGLVVCGDTGVAHVATAVGTPSVVLFGPTSPQRWGPPPERRQHVVLWTGRTGDPHADSPDAGLLEIGVDDVVRATERARAVHERSDEPSPTSTSEVAT